MTDIVFDQRVAVVTGAGGGLGRAYALELARRGARVVVNDLGGAVDGAGGGSAAADQVVAEIESAGGEAVASYESVATPQGGAGVIAAALDAFGTVDIVINNAGILRDKSFPKLDMDDLEAVLSVHLKGAFYVTQPAFLVMKEKGYGRLVFTSSNSGILGNFGQSNYGAAKMGLVGLSNVLAIEGAKYGIKSNVIAPLARTRMTIDLLGPLADKMDPEQVAAMVVYLASEECAFTHQVFSAGGGRYAQFFVGATSGWFAGTGVVPTVEEVAEHLDEIRDTDGFQVLGQISEEIGLLLESMKDDSGAD